MFNFREPSIGYSFDLLTQRLFILVSTLEAVAFQKSLSDAVAKFR